MLCDLHTHSYFSDGTCSPTEIVDKAILSGLSAVALTDHNTVEGLPEFLTAAKKRGIDAVAGAEFSVDYEGRELHILGLFIEPDRFSAVSDLMQDVIQHKEQSNIALIASLARSGIPLDYDEIKRQASGGRVNRAHIASVLTQKGYASSVAEAFTTLLSPTAGHYREPERPTAWKILDFIRSIDAIPVLAHPFLNLTEEELSCFLPLAKEHGLMGMECYYPRFDEKATARAMQMADAFGLLYSGGSDFHGERKPDISLGVGKGNLNIPYEWYLNLKNA